MIKKATNGLLNCICTILSPDSRTAVRLQGLFNDSNALTLLLIIAVSIRFGLVLVA